MDGSVRQLVAGLCAALTFAGCAADPDPPEASPAAPGSEAPERTANQLVDSRPNGQEHSEVGQRVLLFIAGEATDRYVAVRLVQRPDGIFDWYGEPMNDAWDVQVDTAEATALFVLR